MADATTIRRNVGDMPVGLNAGGETDLAGRPIHSEFANQEAIEERRRGPAGAGATGAWPLPATP